jgi:AcrR family transcriptional regulator
VITNSHQDDTKREPARTARQEEILDRAMELVQESGLANLTLKKVAQRVGFTEAAIYRHFTHKQALVFALVDRLRDRLLGPVAVFAADQSLPARERLRRMVLHHVEVIRRTRGLPMLFLAEGVASGDEALLARMRGVMDTYQGLLVAVLRETGLQAEPPLEHQAVQFIGLSAVLGVQLRAFPEQALSDAEADALVSHYVRCLTTCPVPAEEAAP